MLFLVTVPKGVLINIFAIFRITEFTRRTCQMTRTFYFMIDPYKDKPTEI